VANAEDEASVVALDVCILLNLSATSRAEEILQALPEQFAVADRAAGEVLFLRRGGGGPDAEERVPVDLAPLVASGALTLLHLDTDKEVAAYVDFAAELDDGEAMTCALALCRNLAVATDDRKAQRLLSAAAPAVPVYTTPGLLRRWAALRGVSASELALVLAAIQDRARFVPGRRDPDTGWWKAALGAKPPQAPPIGHH